MDDGHRASAGHPGAGVIPACIAVAQEEGSTFEELVSAIILGYEIGCRIAASRDLSRLPTMASGRWVAYGVAASTAFLKRLSKQKTAQAFAIAGIHSPDMAAAGYSRQMGNHVKEGIPWAVLTGMAAVTLAEEGYTGPLDILDHPDYYHGPDIVKGLGQQWAIEEIYFKPYGCCRWIHAAIDALLSLMKEHRLHADSIDRVEVATFRRAVEGLTNEIQPKSVESAQYSLPFSLAVAALEGQKGLLPLRPEFLGRPELVSFAKKVHFREDSNMDRLFPSRAPARVRLTVGAKKLEKTVLSPWGDPENPLKDFQLLDKFRILTEGILSPEHQDGFTTLLLKRNAPFETGKLFNLLTGSKGMVA